MISATNTNGKRTQTDCGSCSYTVFSTHHHRHPSLHSYDTSHPALDLHGKTTNTAPHSVRKAPSQTDFRDRTVMLCKHIITR